MEHPTHALVEARKVLVRIGLPAGKRLFEAGLEFTKAMQHAHRWPGLLCAGGEELLTRLHTKGELYATVASMYDAEAQMLVNDLRRFIDDCLLKLEETSGGVVSPARVPHYA